MSVDMALRSSQSRAAPVELHGRQRTGIRGRPSPYEVYAGARVSQSALQRLQLGAVVYGLQPDLRVDGRSEQEAMEETTPEAAETWFRLSVILLFVSVALSASSALSGNAYFGGAGAAAMAGCFLSAANWLKTCG